jgi:fluoride exporter
MVVGFGGFLGACLRYWVQTWAIERWGPSFPYGTLLINLTGSFVMGLFLVLAADRLVLDPRWRVFFTIGVLSSYTTFSTYTYESVQLLLLGQWWPGVVNLVLNNLLGLAAAAVGIGLARNL